MANQAVTLLALFSISVAPERPPREPPTPNGPQPEFVTVQMIIEAQKVVIVFQSQTVMVPFTVTVYQDKRPFTKTVYRQEIRMMERAFSLEKGAITDANGKKVSAAVAMKRLKVGATVLWATGPVDPLYLRVIRPDALVLIAPPGPPTLQPELSPPPVFPRVKDKRLELPPGR